MTILLPYHYRESVKSFPVLNTTVVGLGRNKRLRPTLEKQIHNFKTLLLIYCTYQLSSTQDLTVQQQKVNDRHNSFVDMKTRSNKRLSEVRIHYKWGILIFETRIT